MVRVHSLFTNSLFTVGKKPKMVVADSHYGGVEALKHFQDQQIQTCIAPRIHDNSEGRYRNTDFKVIREGQEMECPAGHRVRKETNCLYRIHFHWLKQLCNACVLKEKCTRSIHGRIVSYYQGQYFSSAEALVKSQTGRKLLRVRKVIVEGVIGEARNFHLLRRCRYRILGRFRIQLWLTASAINLKRLMKEKASRIGNGVISAVDYLLAQAQQAITILYFSVRTAYELG